MTFGDLVRIMVDADLEAIQRNRHVPRITYG